MRMLKWFVVATSLLLGAPAHGQDVHVMWKCGTTGFAAFCQVEAANPLPVTVAGGSLTVTSDATATAAAPSYSEGTVNPLSQTLAGNLRVTGVGGSFPITAASGSVASGAVSSGAIASGAFASGSVGSGAVASGAYASGALASGSIASGAMVDLVANQTPIAPATATATKGLLIGGQYDSTQKTLTNGQQAGVALSARGAQFVAVGADGFAVTGTFFQATQPVSIASAQVASGAYASGSIGSGAIASGAVASGAYASGSIASGALASGSIASGAMVDLVALSAPVAPATATATKSVLLGAQTTTAAVNPTTGQQSALSSDTNNNLLVSAGGAPNLSITQVSIATSDTLAIAARALRRAVTVQQITGTQNVFCNQTTATAGNGVVLPAVVGASFTFNTTSAVRCIAVTGAQTVAVAETF